MNRSTVPDPAPVVLIAVAFAILTFFHIAFLPLNCSASSKTGSVQTKYLISL